MHKVSNAITASADHVGIFGISDGRSTSRLRKLSKGESNYGFVGKNKNVKSERDCGSVGEKEGEGKRR